MIEYINNIKRQFRDTYKFKPTGGTKNDPLFNDIPDGTYPMVLDGKKDNVKICGGKIHCCRFEEDE